MLLLKCDFRLLKYVRTELRWAFSGEPPRSFIGFKGKAVQHEKLRNGVGEGRRG